MKLQLKRAYEAPAPADGHRILVDSLWPRGISKTEAKLDRWMKEIAPSTELRKWFNHEPEKWPEFQRRYFEELKEHDALVKELRALARREQVTLVFGAKDEEHNNAVALREYLSGK